MALFARAFWHGEAPETPEMVAKIEQAIEDLRLKLFVVWAEDYEADRQPWEVEAQNPREAVRRWQEEADQPDEIDWDDPEMDPVRMCVKNCTTKERWSVRIEPTITVEWKIEKPKSVPAPARRGARG